MENMQIFNNEEFGEVRIVVIDDDPWFVGKDVAKILEYQNGNRDIIRHVDEEDRLMFNKETQYQNGIELESKELGQRGGWLINESGLYSLILSSKMQAAKKFKRWVTSEVLPIIRKTGGYINNADLMVNTYFSEVSDNQKVLVKGLLSNIEGLQKKNGVLANENALLTKKNLEWADRPLINALVRRYASSIDNDYAKAWRAFKSELLYNYGINLNSRKTAYLNKGGKKGQLRTLNLLDDEELSDAIATAVSLCKENDVNIDDLLMNQAS